MIGFGVQGKCMVIIVDGKAAFLQLQFDFLVFQDLVVRSAQDGLEDSPFQEPVGRAPVHVEEHGKRRGWAVFQKIQPPGIVMAQGHVVGHDVKQESHAP